MEANRSRYRMQPNDLCEALLDEIGQIIRTTQPKGGAEYEARAAAKLSALKADLMKLGHSFGDDPPSSARAYAKATGQMPPEEGGVIVFSGDYPFPQGRCGRW